MNSALLVVGSIVVGLAAVIHVYIFYLESIAWSRPRTWKVFGVRSQQDADVLRPMAYNQGYYNAFLAIGVVIGLILLWTPDTQQAGFALALFSALSMVAAALVLVTSNRKMIGAALLQGMTPALGSGLLLLSLIG